MLTVIEEAPRRLTEVKGISPKRAETIHQSLCMQLSMRRLLDFLSAHGLSLSLAMPLYRRYGDLALTALRANPYLLTEEPLFTPFPAADKLARELGLEADDPLRLEAGLLYTLSHNLDNGHVFLPYAKLLTAAQRLLGTESSVLEDHLEGLTDRGTIVRRKLPARMPATWPGSTTARPMWPTPCWRWRGNRSAPQRTWTRSWTEFSGNRVSPTPPCRWRR